MKRIPTSPRAPSLIIHVAALLVLGLSFGRLPSARADWSVVQEGGPEPVPIVRGLYMLNATVGYATLSNGALLKTFNGWNTSVLQATSPSGALLDVDFSDVPGEENHGVAVGFGGVILRTNDSGLNWFPQNSGFSSTIRKVDMTDLDHIIAIGGGDGAVYLTSDGGTTWPSFVFLSYIPNGLDMVDNNFGCTVGNDGEIGYTVNRFASDLTGNSNTTSHLHAVHMVNSTVGYAVGTNGTIIKTTDGCANWTVLDSGTTQTLEDVHFVDANTGWAVGANGTILRTSDGGATWGHQSLGSQRLWAVHMIDANIGFAAGENATILGTSDGGGSVVTELTIQGNPSGSTVPCGPWPVWPTAVDWPMEFQVSNTGTVPLSGLTFALSGPHLADFRITNAPADTLAPGATSPLNILYDPRTGGNKSVTLTINSNRGHLYTLHFAGKTYSPPSVRFLGKRRIVAKRGGKIRVRGTVSDAEGDVTGVSVRGGRGNWQVAKLRGKRWSRTIRVTKKARSFRILARAADVSRAVSPTVKGPMVIIRKK